MLVVNIHASPSGSAPNPHIIKQTAFQLNLLYPILYLCIGINKDLTTKFVRYQEDFMEHDISVGTIVVDDDDDSALSKSV